MDRETDQTDQKACTPTVNTCEHAASNRPHWDHALSLRLLDSEQSFRHAQQKRESLGDRLKALSVLGVDVDALIRDIRDLL